MSQQPELSVEDFFALGNAAAAHTASLRKESPSEVNESSTPFRETPESEI